MAKGKCGVRQEEAEGSRLVVAVAKARRRVITNQGFREAGWALTIALLGPTAFLVLGKDSFAWPLLVIFALAGAGLAAWRLWKRRPGAYEISQALDARLATADQISTAIYFLDSQDPVAVEQRRRAASLTERIDLDAAFPFTVPHSLYGVASVFLLASALCALRYFLEKPFRVNRPLPEVIAQAIRHDQTAQEKGRPNPPQEGKHLPEERAKAYATDNAQEQNPVKPEQAKDISEPQASGAAPADQKSDQQSDEQKSQAEQQEPPQTSSGFGDPMQSAENYPIQSYEDMLERDGKSGADKAQGNESKNGNNDQNGKGAGDPDSSSTNSSLFSKLKEAMSNMLSRLQQKSAGDAGKQQQGAQGDQSAGNEPKDGAGQANSASNGQPKAGSQDGAEAQAVSSDAKDASAQKSSNKNTGNMSDKGSHSAGSGAGREDGDKQVLEAQQQQAMGKLSELYGRRAANVSGEVTVEAQSGKQTLRTPQSQKQAHHADNGGEVSRDEIPLAYQPFIKEYFNKIREAKK